MIVEICSEHLYTLLEAILFSSEYLKDEISRKTSLFELFRLFYDDNNSALSGAAAEFQRDKLRAFFEKKFKFSAKTPYHKKTNNFNF